ncbi:hypothetical protein KCTC52924_02664 [Arenibacter antarcticus]
MTLPEDITVRRIYRGELPSVKLESELADKKVSLLV